jgi:glycosyltransferase involved in cell wall biosynthesis
VNIAFFDYVCDPAHPATTGLSDLVWDMASRLAQAGDTVHVVAPYTTDDYPQTGVNVHRYPIPLVGYRNMAGHLLIINRGASKLRTLGHLDIIHTPEYLSPSWITRRLPRIPLVFTEPGNIYERIENGNPYDWSATLAYKFGARATAKRCAGMVATSSLMASWWNRTGVDVDKITLVPLGLDTEVFRPVIGAREGAGWAPDRRHLLYVARLSRENGPDLALRAFAKSHVADNSLMLHMIGSGPEMDSLKHLATELGVESSVAWYGWVDLNLLPTYYSAADLFMFPGSSGGTPRVVIQAMACGACCVAARIGGIVDHITDGQTGVMHEPGDVDHLATLISDLMPDEDRRSRISNAAHDYARTQLDWDVLVPRIRETVYRPAIQRWSNA